MKKDFTILGIESTCDETSAALLKGGKEILSNVIYSQIDEHKKYHGVVPELASRAHAAKIATVIGEALQNHPIDYVAFASGPGLPGGLMVGRVAAETLAKFKKVPIIGVNHLEGHIFACDFEGSEAKNKLQFPLIALVVSGGHTELWYVKNYGDYKVLGKTRDDAAGEAFDKVAKLLGLAYPGGGRRYPNRHFRASGMLFIFRGRCCRERGNFRSAVSKRPSVIICATIKIFLYPMCVPVLKRQWWKLW